MCVSLPLPTPLLPLLLAGTLSPIHVSVIPAAGAAQQLVHKVVVIWGVGPQQAAPRHLLPQEFLQPLHPGGPLPQKCHRHIQVLTPNLHTAFG
jgi:hypothetical protein